MNVELERIWEEAAEVLPRHLLGEIAENLKRTA
jgi:hypothetical protein